jgi:hypothetical protein
MTYRADLLRSDAEIPDVSTFALTCGALAADLRSNPERWATTDLADYLESIGRYAAEHLPAFYANVRGGDVPNPPSWLVFADLLRAGRVYDGP